MLETILPQFINTDMLQAIAAEPNGAMTTCNLLQMVSLAVKDPEGCVRFSPYSFMDADAFSRAFNCSVSLVLNSISTLRKYGILTVQDGKMFIEQLRLLKKEEAKEEKKLLDGRQRVKKYRAQKKKKEATAANPVTPPVSERKPGLVTGSVTDTVTNSVTENVTPVVTSCENVTKTHMETAVSTSSDTLCNAKCNARKKGTSVNNINNNYLYAKKPISLYADKANKTDKISLDKLPAPCRRVLEVWNKLPVQKFDGLIPALQKKLEDLLARYGEAAIVKAIAGIAKSAFLLGKKGTGWIITFSWLLEPGNFAKVLAGKYLDSNSGSSGYADWLPGERCPFYLPGEGDEELSGDDRKAALYALAHPTNPRLEKAKRLLA